MALEVLLDDEAHLDDLRAAFRVEVDGRRLDLLVAERLAVSVREVQRLCAAGRLRVDGRAVLAGGPRLARGARVAVLGEAARPALLPEAIPLPVLFEDERVLVIDKPAGLPMTPGTGHPAGTVANALRGLGRPLSTLEGPLRPGIVHRLDRGTSGALIVCKDDAIHEELARDFLAHRVVRRYLAVVHGHPEWDELTVDAPLGRRRVGRKAQAVRADGRPASTRFTVRERWPDGLALVEAAPATGRKHQVRVHLAHVGHPLAGDTLYAGGDGERRRLWARLGLRRPALHAAEIGAGARWARAPLPADLAGCRAMSGPPLD